MILGFGPTEMVMVLVFCLFQALPWILFTVV